MHRLENLIVFVDRNKLQISGPTTKVMNYEPLDQRWSSFGWGVRIINGHDFEMIIRSVDEAPFEKGKPSVIIADTIKSKGLSFAEGRVDYHYWKAKAEEMEQADHLSAGEVYLDGISNVLAEPEFSGSEEARRPLRLLEEREKMKDLIARTLQGSSVGMVQVLIGGEGTWDDLRQCSLVLARYGAPGLAMGSLGVIGPMRMSYGRTISTVRFLSSLLSDLVSDSLGEDHTEFAR